MRLTLAAFLFTLTAQAGAAATCGGSFSSFVDGLKSEAATRGYDASTTERFFSSVSRSEDVLRADRAQGIFQKPFTDFARTLISANRLQTGQAKGREWDGVFDRIENSYGVNRGVLLAIWAFETDFGGFQGNFNTANALVTLAHDCRRPELFRPQVFAALELYAQGSFDPAATTGAWAGEIGMVQMLPGDILAHGKDGDGDGRVSLKTSPADALISGADLLAGFGWRPREPWLQEVTVPASMDWSEAGIHTRKPAQQWAALGVRARDGKLANLPASLILPEGHRGPAFIAYPNFSIYFDWNQSFTYVLTAAYFATRLEGAPVFDARAPEPGLSGEQMKALQRKLAQKGHDVGKIDGILGAGTRAAVRAEQVRLGLPADAWPTKVLLDRL
ncbi:MAG: lytic murein transglycosylase [Pseudomonadota bacterium]